LVKVGFGWKADNQFEQGRGPLSSLP